MPSLLQGQDITCFTGSLHDHFLTFSQLIVVNKEAKKTISNISTRSLAGYPAKRQEASYTLTPQSGQFYAHITYNKNQNLVDENNLQLRTSEGDIWMKTSGEAKDYILDGKTENILVDNKLYNVTSSPEVRKFLGLDFFVFKLTETN